MAVEIIAPLAAELGHHGLGQLGLAGSHGADDPHVGVEHTGRVVGIPAYRPAVLQCAAEQHLHGADPPIPGLRFRGRSGFLLNGLLLRSLLRDGFLLNRLLCGSLLRNSLLPGRLLLRGLLRSGFLRGRLLLRGLLRSGFLRDRLLLRGLLRGLLRDIRPQDELQQGPAMGAERIATDKAVAVAGVVRHLPAAQHQPGVMDEPEAAQSLALHATLPLAVHFVRQHGDVSVLRQIAIGKLPAGQVGSLLINQLPIAKSLHGQGGAVAAETAGVAELIAVAGVIGDKNALFLRQHSRQPGVMDKSEIAQDLALHLGGKLVQVPAPDDPDLLLTAELLGGLPQSVGRCFMHIWMHSSRW